MEAENLHCIFMAFLAGDSRMNLRLEQLVEAASAYVDKVMEEQKAGVPLVAYTSSFVPAELIRAAGANTYMLCRGGELAPAEKALEYTISSINPQARALFGYLAEDMDPVAAVAKLVVTAYYDSHMSRISELLEFKGVPVCKIGIPIDWKETYSFDYYVHGLRSMLRRVEEITGKSPDPELAKTEFEKTNRIKVCLKRLQNMRKGKRIPIDLESVLQLHEICPLLTEEKDIRCLEQLIASLDEAPNIFAENAPRLLLISRIAAQGDTAILRMLDECGCPVVAEVIDECVCISDGLVDLQGDLIENFAKSRYSEVLPVSAFQPSWKQRFEKIQKLICEYGIDGVIWYQLENDEIYDMEYRCVRKWLTDMGIPSLKVETDYDYSDEKLGIKRAQITQFADQLWKTGR